MPRASLIHLQRLWHQIYYQMDFQIYRYHYTNCCSLKPLHSHSNLGKIPKTKANALVDLEKAFDTIVRNELSTKLAMYEVNNRLIQSLQYLYKDCMLHYRRWYKRGIHRRI